MQVTAENDYPDQPDNIIHFCDNSSNQYHHSICAHNHGLSPWYSLEEHAQCITARTRRQCTVTSAAAACDTGTLYMLTSNRYSGNPDYLIPKMKK